MGADAFDWFRDENGEMTRRIPTGEILVPGTIKLDSDNLVWEFGDSYRAIQPGPGMLEGFLRVSTARPEAVLRYAKTWGVLVLDSKGRPCAEGRLRGIEPLAVWRYFSRRARALLNIAAAVENGKTGSLDDWREIAMLDASREEFNRTIETSPQGLPWHYWDMTAIAGREPVESARHVVESDLNAWLGLSSARRMHGRPDFAVYWTGRWEIRIDYHGFLFAALAFQLALSVTRARGLYTCSGCGNPYLRVKDAPRRGEANFCEQCGRKEAIRQADQRRRKKKAEACRLRARGLSLGEIATRLNTKTKHVRNWIKGR